MTNFFVYGFNICRRNIWKRLMIKFNLKKIRKTTGKFKPAFKDKQDSQTNPLERTPNTDTVEISPVKTRTLSANDRKTALKNFNKVKTAKLLNDEIMFLLQPKTNASGEKTFTLNQAKILNAASKKVDFYKEIAKRLEDEGNSNIDTIVKDMKKVFGGEKEYGKYIQARIKDGSPSSKDAKSIYNKLTKEFQEEKLNKEIMNSFSRRLYQKPYKMLDHDEKELVKLSVYLMYDFDLILSGHAHGGLWRFPPLINGVYAPGQGIFPKYAGGRYNFHTKEGTVMIVSRGLAYKSPAVPRILNSPEVVLVELIPMQLQSQR